MVFEMLIQASGLVFVELPQMSSLCCISAARRLRLERVERINGLDNEASVCCSVHTIADTSHHRCNGPRQQESQGQRGGADEGDGQRAHHMY